MLAQLQRSADDPDDPTDRTARWFEDHRDRPTMLRAFLRRVPKAGSDRAREQWPLEAEFAEFENLPWSQ